MEATAGFFTYPSYGSYQAPMPSYVPDKSRQYNESPFGGQQVPLNPLPQQPQAFLLSTLDQVDASSPWLYSGLPPNNYGYNQSPSMSMLSTTAMPSQYLLPTTAAEPTTSFPGMNNYSHQLQPSIGTFCQDYSSGAYVNFGGIPSAAMQESEEMPMSSEKVHMMPNFNRKSLKQSFLHQLSQLSQHQCQWLGCYAEFPSAEKLSTHVQCHTRITKEFARVSARAVSYTPSSVLDSTGLDTSTTGSQYVSSQTARPSLGSTRRSDSSSSVQDAQGKYNGEFYCRAIVYPPCNRSVGRHSFKNRKDNRDIHELKVHNMQLPPSSRRMR